MRCALLLLSLGISVTLPGCRPAKIIHLPGQERTVDIAVTFAEIPPALLSSIGSFSLTLQTESGVQTTYLSYGDGGFTWVDDTPLDLDPHGAFSVQLEAQDFSSSPLPVGGRSREVDLDTVADGGTLELPVLISTTERFSSLPTRLKHARFSQATSLLVDGTLLVTGGVTAAIGAAPFALAAEPEWISPGIGPDCVGAPGDASAACSWGEVSPPRLGHFAVSLADFGPDCPSRNGVVFGLGADAQGSGLDDLYRFDPAGFEGSGALQRIGASVSPRVEAAAYATRDCRIVLLGGRDAWAGAALSSATVIDLSGATPQVREVTGFLTEPRSGGGVFHLDNTLDEVILTGGLDAGGASLGSAVSLLHENDLESCDLDDGACNGGAASMLCPRPDPVAVRFPTGDPLSPALILGDPGACAGTGNAIEFFLSTNNAIVNRFVPFGGTVPASFTGGFTATAEDRRTSLIVGGMDGSTPTDRVFRFTLEGELDANSSIVQGRFAELTPLTQPLADHTAHEDQGTLLLVGGWDGTTPSDQIRVRVAGF